MESTLSKVTDTVSDAFKGITEITKERIFTPMYFYFLTAWVVTNWKFVYTMFFVDNKFIMDTQGVVKIDYLSAMYSVEWFLPLLNTTLKLFIIPVVSSFVIIWWLSKVSERYFQKYEEHQMNKRVIKRDVDYRERTHYVISERKIREEEIDKVNSLIKYEVNSDFNNWLDDHNDGVMVAKVPMLPSEVLYKTDYEAYKTALDEYTNHLIDEGEDLAVQTEIDRRRGK